MKTGEPTYGINLILALHNHQPEGNLPEVFERTFSCAYEPFISELELFPEIKFTLHYSGILLQWLKDNRPDFLERLRTLISRNQVEMMGGAFFEPILVMISDEDKIGQIEKQNRFIREHFQVDAKGAWLAERIWELHLALPLAQAGIRYTVLDDAHFHKVGFSENDTLHYYITEEAGKRIFIFPISEKLRYLIPFAEPGETIAYLRSIATAGGDRVVVLADDGEKLGSWPGTSKHVYKEGWLKRFFSLLCENQDWLRVTTFQDYYRDFPPAGQVYLPTGSYREMMEWSGGFWRNFFVRYPESNHIHKKMLHIREKLAVLPDGAAKQEALDNLWAGQCNCAYWHGIFGGLYLNFLRSALYQRLIKAEQVIDSARHAGGSWIELEQKDFDYDGNDELLVNGPDLGLVFSPAKGGALIELDYKTEPFNLLDVLTRRPEAYHCNIFELDELHCSSEEVRTIHHLSRVKEAGLAKHLVYDAYRRVSLVDHFFQKNTTLADFNNDVLRVEAGDFVNRPYLVEQAVADGTVRIILSREGLVQNNGLSLPVKLSKTVEYFPQEGKIQYNYVLLNNAEKLLETTFAVEFNINFLAGSAPDRYYRVPGRQLEDSMLNSRGEVVKVMEFGLVDEWKGISTDFSLDIPADLWRLPVETVSQSEDGMERVYQGSSVIPRWEITLEQGQVWKVCITQRVKKFTREAG